MGTVAVDPSEVQSINVDPSEVQDAPKDSALSRTGSNYWEQVNPVAQYKAIGDTLYGLATPPLQTLSKVGEANDAPRMRAIQDFKKGDYTSGIGHGIDWLLNAVPGVGSTVMKASDQWEAGDHAGAVGTFGGLLTNLIATPKIAGKAVDVANVVAKDPKAISNALETAATGTKGAAKGAVQGLTAMNGMRYGLPIPDVAAGTLAGRYAGEALGGLVGAPKIGEAVGTAIGAASPVVRGAYRGAKEALGNLAARRALVEEANASAQHAAYDAANAIHREIYPDGIPPSRQLPPASQTQMGPVPPPSVGNIDYTPPNIPASATTVRVTSGPLGSPQPASAPVSAPVPPETQATPALPIAPNEMVTRDEIAQSKSIVKTPKKTYPELDNDDKIRVERAYAGLHGLPSSLASPVTRVTTADELAAQRANSQPAAGTPQESAPVAPAPEPEPVAEPTAETPSEPLPESSPEPTQAPAKTRSDYHDDVFDQGRQAGLITGTGSHTNYVALKAESANVTKNGKPMKSLRDLDADEMKALAEHVKNKFNSTPSTGQ